MMRFLLPAALGAVAVGVAYGPQIVEQVKYSTMTYRNVDGSSSQTVFQDDQTSTRMTTIGQHADGTKFTSNGAGSFNPTTRTATYVMELDKGRKRPARFRK